MRHMRRLLPPLLLMIGCEGFTGPKFPADTLREIEPPESFRLAWELTQGCAGISGDLLSIRWFIPRDGETLSSVGSREYAGYWWESGNRIALKGTSDLQVVRHEMLHALLQRGDHPLGYFADRCGGMITFAGLPEGYGATQDQVRAAVVANPNEVLSVSVSLVPLRRPLREYGGAVAFLVTARNTTSRTVWIPLVGQVDATAVYNRTGIGGVARNTASRILFLPGQTRSVVVDAVVADTGIVAITGSYAGVPSAPTFLSIIP